MRRTACRAGWLLFYAILFFLLIGYIVYPMLNTLRQAFLSEGQFTTAVFTDYITNPNNLQVIENTLWVGLGAVVCCGVLGTALALYMTFCARRFRKALHVLLLSPMMIPGVIIVIAFVQLYGESGILTKAVEALFPGTKVKAVNTMNCRGALKRMGRYQGYTASWKKAVVTLTADSKGIEFFESMQ